MNHIINYFKGKHPDKEQARVLCTAVEEVFNDLKVDRAPETDNYYTGNAKKILKANV